MNQIIAQGLSFMTQTLIYPVFYMNGVKDLRLISLVLITYPIAGLFARLYNRSFRIGSAMQMSVLLLMALRYCPEWFYILISYQVINGYGAALCDVEIKNKYALTFTRACLVAGPFLTRFYYTPLVMAAIQFIQAIIVKNTVFDKPIIIHDISQNQLIEPQETDSDISWNPRYTKRYHFKVLSDYTIFINFFVYMLGNASFTFLVPILIYRLEGVFYMQIYLFPYLLLQWIRRRNKEFIIYFSLILLSVGFLYLGKDPMFVFLDESQYLTCGSQLAIGVGLAFTLDSNIFTVVTRKYTTKYYCTEVARQLDFFAEQLGQILGFMSGILVHYLGFEMSCSIFAIILYLSSFAHLVTVFL